MAPILLKAPGQTPKETPMKKLLSITLKFFFALQISAASYSVANADSFPHCAPDDAKCVGEVLLYQIRMSGNGGNQIKTTFCTCDTPRFADYCRYNGGSEHYYKVLILKRISDGSEISQLADFRNCTATSNPALACDASLATHPACR
jgi:hypothetical protein